MLPSAGAAEGDAAPRLVGAENLSDKLITLTYNTPLTAAEGSSYAVTTLEASKFKVEGVEGVDVREAFASGYHVSLSLNRRLDHVSSVELSIAAGAVTSRAGTANAAVSGYRIQTLVGMVGILEAMNAKDEDPNISHVLRYVRSGNVSNVVGASGVGSEDIRFLLELSGMAATGKSTLNDLITDAEIILASSEYADVTGTLRTAFKEQVSAAKKIRDEAGSVLYDYGMAGLALARSYGAFMDYHNLPLEPRLRLIGSRAGEMRLTHTLDTQAMHRLYVPAGMTVDQLKLEVGSRYNFAVRASATSAETVDGGTVLTKEMVVAVDVPNSKMYEILPERSVSTYAELSAAAGDSSLRSIFIQNDISAPQAELIIASGMTFRAEREVRVTIAKKISSGMEWSGNVYFVAHADDDQELSDAINSMGFNEIVAAGIGAFNGTLSIHRELGHWLYYKLGETAYVGNQTHLLQALADPAIAKVYLPGDIKVDGALTFPGDREYVIAASVPRMLKAGGFTNAPDAANLTNVQLVDLSALSGHITGFEIGEGYLHGFDVVFNANLPALAWNQAKEALIDRIVVTDEYGDEFELTGYDLIWDDAHKNKFRIDTNGFYADWQQITVYLIEDEPTNGLKLADAQVKYTLIPTYGEIINPVLSESKLVSFDIKFNRALAENSINKLLTDPGELIGYLYIEDEADEHMIYIGDIADAQFSELGSHTFRLTGLEYPIFGELHSITVDFYEDHLIKDYEGIPVKVSEAVYIPAVSSDEAIAAAGMSFMTRLVKLDAGFGDYAGLYFKDIEGSYFKRADGTAIAFNYASLEQALDDENVHTIYVAADIEYEYPILEFPSRPLTINARMNRTISADSIQNDEVLVRHNVVLNERFVGLGARVEPVIDDTGISVLNLAFNQSISESVYGSGTIIDAVDFYYAGSSEPTVVDEANISDENWSWDYKDIALTFASPYPGENLAYAKVTFKSGVFAANGEPMSVLTYTSDVGISIADTINNDMLASLSVDFTERIAMTAVDAGKNVLNGPIYVSVEDHVKIINDADYTVTWNGDRTRLTINFNTAIPVGNIRVTAWLNPNVVVPEDGRKLEQYKIFKWYLV